MQIASLKSTLCSMKSYSSSGNAVIHEDALFSIAQSISLCLFGGEDFQIFSTLCLARSLFQVLTLVLLVLESDWRGLLMS